MPQGTIKRLVDRGFGFIGTSGEDLFFHRSTVVEGRFEDLREGQTVSYEEGTSHRGPCAENVRPA